ncbi:MAG TPA: SLC13 family permease [Symbiobacteriaceae bacterium]|nr:SLC13 family permease [Symbiobacteriaceae bacterium]
MSLPVISLIALIIAIVVSVLTERNIGTLALGLSLVVGYYIGGQKVASIIAGYPTSLFIMLAGVTYLFALAQVNGTLEKITKYAIKSVRGKVALLPIVLFFLAFILAAIGPGHISISALLAAPAMLLAESVGIPPLLMALVVGNGAQAGAMSPIAPTGIIANGILEKMNVTGFGFTLWMNMLVTHVAASALAYFLFGGMKLWKQKDQGQIESLLNIEVEPFNKQQWMTLAGIAALILGVIIFKLDVGLGAFGIGAILSLLKAADEGKAIKAMPWNTIMMVTGVTVLVSLMSKIGGMELFADIMAKFSTPFTATLVVGFIAAIISAYASTSGVILPAFLPLAPLLLDKIGGGSLLALVSTIVVAGHLTDLSPLSTTGAVFIAQAGPKTDKSKIFRDMMLWGLSMSVVGAFISWLFFTVLRVP